MMVGYVKLLGRPLLTLDRRSNNCVNGLVLRTKQNSDHSGSLRFVHLTTSENEVHFDSNWPSDNQPKTPYSLFQLTESSFTKALLKKRFHELARLYHPDHSANKAILKRNRNTELTSSSVHQNLLTSEDKIQRFKIITEAYELLKDPKRKNQYDRLGLGWAYGPRIQSPAQRYEQSSRYYNAGTWEDYSDLRNDDKQDIGPMTMLIWFFGIFGIIQLTSLLTRWEEAMNKTNFTHDETERDLTLAYINYGLDEDKWSRLRRFLWFRTFGLYRNKEDLDREAKKNEAMINELKNK